MKNYSFCYPDEVAFLRSFCADNADIAPLLSVDFRVITEPVYIGYGDEIVTEDGAREIFEVAPDLETYDSFEDFWDEETSGMQPYYRAIDRFYSVSADGVELVRADGFPARFEDLEEALDEVSRTWDADAYASPGMRHNAFCVTICDIEA